MNSIIIIKIIRKNYIDGLSFFSMLEIIGEPSKEYSSIPGRSIYFSPQHFIYFFQNKEAYDFYYHASTLLRSYIPRVEKHGSYKGRWYIAFQRIHEPAQLKKARMALAPEFLSNSAQLLASIHNIPVSQDISGNIHHYMEKAFLVPETQKFREQYERLWGQVKDTIEPTLAHRDFHQDNLLWGDKLYIIDLGGVCGFDFYYDLISAFCFMCKGDLGVFRKFLAEYRALRPFQFSKKTIRMQCAGLLLERAPGFYKKTTV